MTVEIQFIDHHNASSDALKDLARKKFQKILKHHLDKVLSVNITFDIEKLTHSVAADVHIPGTSFHAKATSEDMYAAIDDLVHKIDKQLIKHKGKQSDH